jgi:hypothetical protein
MWLARMQVKILHNLKSEGHFYLYLRTEIKVRRRSSQGLADSTSELADENSLHRHVVVNFLPN